MDGSTVLPQLQNGSVRVENTASYPPFYRSSRGHNTFYRDNGEQHQQQQIRGGNRKYRGQKSQRRDQEYYPKDNQRLQQHHQQPPHNM